MQTTYFDMPSPVLLSLAATTFFPQSLPANAAAVTVSSSSSPSSSVASKSFGSDRSKPSSSRSKAAAVASAQQLSYFAADHPIAPLQNLEARLVKVLIMMAHANSIRTTCGSEMIWLSGFCAGVAAGVGGDRVVAGGPGAAADGRARSRPRRAAESHAHCESPL
jgi:hypothetical protein